MMFDPPDYPFKELTESLRDHYGPDDLLFTNSTVVTDSISNDRDLVKATESFISTVEAELSLNSNISGRYFNVENAPILDTEQPTNELNSDLYVLQPDSFYNYEPTLLDENTVNQFLLPVQVSSEKNNPIFKEEEDTGPHLLALHSCVICHEIFTTDADLLDHTISLHCSDKEQEPTTILTSAVDDPVLPVEDVSSFNGTNLECEWLVCAVCERVLATALETKPRELLCCPDLNGKSNTSVRKFSTMFVCDYCNYLFANGDAMDRHRLICFGQEDFYAGEMGKSSLESSSPEISSANENRYPNMEAASQQTTSVRPRRSYSTANSNKMWNCGSCNQLFATARDLYRHKRGEDRPAGSPLTAYVCKECDKVLGSMCALHTHKKMHKVSKPGYPCRVCGRRFNQSGHLAIHMRMHTGERPYPCDLCSKAFKVKVERDDHRRTHTGERPFACAECPKTFTAAARLREHARIHTDQRPYKCDICGAAFRRPYARTVHTLIHTGEKPHECDVCGTAFRRSGDMWKHKRTLHGIQAVNGDAN